MDILVFEESGVSDLAPLTLGRSAAEIPCGGRRLVDLVAHLGDRVTLLVRPFLQPRLAADYPQFSVTDAGVGACDPSEIVLCLDARLVPSFATQRALETALRAGQRCVLGSGGAIVAACVTLGDLQLAADCAGEQIAHRLAELTLPRRDAALDYLEFPHDVLRHHLTTIDDNLQSEIEAANYREILDGVFADGNVSISDYVVCDTAQGPIVLHSEVAVGPHVLLRGPLSVGSNARINAHAAIKEFTWLGAHTKVGGEVEASIVDSYSNKQHHGFLGHSIVGSWVNLGAGTSNSDLKNTYGNVNMEYRGQKVSTGLQFVGAIVGDYVKTAINSSIYTGKTIGVASMIYGTVATNVPSFVNYARQFGSQTTLPPEVAITMQERMFARRGREPRPCDVQ